jgi:hypothetical protein
MGCSSSVPDDTEAPSDFKAGACTPSLHNDQFENHEKEDSDEKSTETEEIESQNDNENDHASGSSEEKSEVASIDDNSPVVIKYIYEYERLHPHEGWGAGHLLPSDKGRYSSRDRRAFSRDSVKQVLEAHLRDWEIVVEDQDEEKEEGSDINVGSP